MKQKMLNFLVLVITIFSILAILELGSWVTYKKQAITAGQTSLPTAIVNGKVIFDVKEKLEEKKMYRIAVLGDSFTWCDNIGQEHCYVTQLAKKLNDKEELYEVYNFGVGGFNTVEELNLFKKKVLGYKPDIAILQYFINDIQFTPKNVEGTNLLIETQYDYEFYQMEPIPLIFPLPDKLNRFFAKNSYFFRFASIKYLNMKKNLQLGEEKNFHKAGLEESFDALKEMAQICMENSIKFIVVLFPEPTTDGCEQSKDLYTKLETHLKELGIPFLNLCKEFEWLDFEEIRDKNEKPNYAHYNQKGHEMVANTIYQNLIKKGHIIQPEERDTP